MDSSTTRLADIPSPRERGAVAYALRSMISKGVVEKITLPSGAIVYRITSWGHIILETCLGIVKILQEVKQPPPYMNEREFKLAKRWASVLADWLSRSEPRQEKVIVKRAVRR